MDFAFDQETQRFRSDAREFFAETIPSSYQKLRFEWPYDPALNQRVATWREDHLRDRSVFEAAIFAEEAERVGFPLQINNPTLTIAQTLMVIGSEEQKTELVPRMLNGELLFSLGFTEPDSGSDVAAARTAAVRDGDEWIINGQKMFTSHAQFATHIFLLTRTNKDVPKHQGLTLFIIPTATPGVEVQPLDTLAKHPTTMTFYTEARIPDSARVGDIDAGWSVMKLALSFERVANSSLLTWLTEAMTEYFVGLDEAGEESQFADPVLRERVARLAIDDEVSRLLFYRTLWRISKGEVPGVEANISKLFGTECYVNQSNEMADVLGTAGMIGSDEEAAPLGGWIDYSFRDSQVRTVAGGSSEIQRDIIAERRLGLPRTRPRT